MRQFFRYCLVGGIAAALHFLILIGLVEFVGIAPIIATTVGFIFAVVLNYVMQYHWTFSASGPHRLKLLKFSSIAVFAMFINGGIFWLCNTLAGAPYLLSQFVATGIVVAINFRLNRHYVFSEEPAR